MNKLQEQARTNIEREFEDAYRAFYEDGSSATINRLCRAMGEARMHGGHRYANELSDAIALRLPDHPETLGRPAHAAAVRRECRKYASRKHACHPRREPRLLHLRRARYAVLKWESGISSSEKLAYFITVRLPALSALTTQSR